MKIKHLLFSIQYLENHMRTLMILCLGCVLFLFICGWPILQPTYADWLFIGDSGTHFMGWHFFRNTSWLQFPLGLNPKYGMEMSSTIVFTDSIPLMALFFKIFSSFLPSIFQYFGLWLLLCFFLQLYFSFKILSLFTYNKFLPLIGSIFFAIAPPFIHRLEGHYAFLGQWTLLAAIYLYFNYRHSSIKWFELLFVTSMIHAYLLFMVLFLYYFSITQRILVHEISYKKAILIGLVGTFVTVITMWSVGYFVIKDDVMTAGYNQFNMNLTALFDSTGAKWSSILPDLPKNNIGGEGFNFMGLGAILLSLAAIYCIFSCRFKEHIDWYKITPVLLFAIILTLFSLSNVIRWNNNIIFSYDIPPLIINFAKIFRASGRFFWPVFYLLYLLIFYILFHSMKFKAVALLCVLSFFIQVADSHYAYSYYHEKFTIKKSWNSPLTSQFWEKSAKLYNKIIFVLPSNEAKGYFPLALFAQENGMSINCGYFARYNEKRLLKYRKELDVRMLKGDFNDQSMYIICDEKRYLDKLKKIISGKDLLKKIDGYYILAPSYNKNL